MAVNSSWGEGAERERESEGEREGGERGGERERERESVYVPVQQCPVRRVSLDESQSLLVSDKHPLSGVTTKTKKLIISERKWMHKDS